MTTPSVLLARLAVQGLRAAGVRHVVLCPGSRSAPLAYALADSDAALHVRHDERVAAFTALGVGLHAGAGAVVTTSGTAAANLHPAVLEAHHANTPLVVVTADRPPALRGTWANQTSELQAGLFGDAVRARLDLDDAAAAADPEAAWTALLGALAAAFGGGGRRPGPVHLDLGFTDPLVPLDDEPPAVVPAGAVAVDSGPPAVPEPLAAGPRTVVLAGDRAGDAARRLAEAGGYPLLAEPSSGARSGPNAVAAYRLLLEQAELAGRIERVVAFGRPTLSRPVTRLLAREEVEVVLVSPYDGWPDPGRPVRRAASLVADGVGDAGWLAAWRAAGAAAATAVDAVLDAGGLTGPLVAREVAAALAVGEPLVAGSSNAVRDLDLAAREATTVVANRGLAGIDGTLSTATGLALSTGRRVRVLVGDLAFLHDANALLPEPGTRRPDVQAVLLDDDGGGIFSLLEHGQRATTSPSRAEVFERAFGTPHGVDVAALCRAYGVPHVPVTDLQTLRRALAEPLPGTSVVHVRLPAGYRAGLRDLHALIRKAVQQQPAPSPDRSTGPAARAAERY